MRDWSLSSGDPLHLTLAADARLCKPDYVNDHIWEAEIGSSDPDRSAIALNTTFGLRARSMRIYLRFTENNTYITDPNTFAGKPSLRRFYPNFLTIDFVPIENLNVTTEFWVPESHAVAGRVLLTNKSNATRQIKMEVCAALSPLDGQAIIPTQQQLVNILAGQTGGIAPVIFMTGGPKHGPGPHSSLMLDLELGPGASRQIAFAEAALDTVADSFDLARRSAARPWETERARIEMLAVSQTLDIRTGDSDWDAAFALSQKAAHGLFFSNNEHLPAPSFVSARHIDHGYSRKSDGTDYAPAWNGQTPLDAYYLSSILQAAPQTAKHLLLNFFATQDEEGKVDGKPGLAGQRGRVHAAPLLSTLAWKYYQTTQDEAFLYEIYPKLTKFFWTWFSPEHDRNRDGAPEWSHLLQTGFEDNPLFDTWDENSQGLDISLVHSPSLEAMLVQEAAAIVKIARQIGRPEEETVLIHSQGDRIRVSLNAGWNSEHSLYCYRDRDSGLGSNGQIIGQKKGNGSMRPKAEFENGIRLLIEVQTKNPAAKRPEVEVSEYFTKTKGETELIPGHQFQWRSSGLVATTQKLFSRVGRVSISGLEEKDKVVVKIIDTTAEDISLALPLWAGVPNAHQAHVLNTRNLLKADRFDLPFGMPMTPLTSPAEDKAVLMGVSFPWNQLIAEGLLAYGFRAEAVRLTAHLMNAVILNLKQNRAFYHRYHAEKGTGLGERNSLQGFAPVGLFMQALGVSIFSARKVKLKGRNLFPWTVTIKHKGLTVVRGHEQTVVTFPNGESVIVKDEAPCIVEG